MLFNKNCNSIGKPVAHLNHALFYAPPFIAGVIATLFG